MGSRWRVSLPSEKLLGIPEGRKESRDFNGNYIFNLKEQMRMRGLRETESERKPRVLLIGASSDLFKFLSYLVWFSKYKLLYLFIFNSV
jgi:hypothetical protein